MYICFNNTHPGMIELDLLNMIPHAKFSRLSTLRQLNASKVNLFEHKKLRGWWPVAKQLDGQHVLAVCCISCLIAMFYNL